MGGTPFPHLRTVSKPAERIKMATFHPFPRLVPELRAEIWALAIENRVIRVKLGKGAYSTSPVPAVTRVCRESRLCCAYHKDFNVGSRGRHIWTNFDYDIIHVQASRLFLLPKESIRHLRVELIDDEGKEINEEWMFDYKHEFFYFPRLESSISWYLKSYTSTQSILTRRILETA